MDAKTATLPQARRDGLLVERSGRELLVHDGVDGRSHHLNATAAWVWQRCDGRTRVVDAAELLTAEWQRRVDTGVVLLALEALDQARLLATAPPRQIAGCDESRRTFLRHLGLGGAMLLLPAVTSLPVYAQAAKPEEVHFNRPIVTPSGTALGGSVDLIMRSDGTYKAHFHMHDSGVPDYKFLVRALFATTNGIVFAWQHSGSVEGTSSTKLTRGPHRNNDAEVEGSHYFIRHFWNDVKAGKFHATKEYSATGVIGFVEDAARAVIDLAEGAGKDVAGAVVGLGDEMVKTLDSLELGGSVGLLSGFAVLTGGGSLVLALASGVAAGKMTKALIRQRPIAAQEYEFAKQVFGNTLPAARRIILTNLHSVAGRGFTMPSPSNDIFVNLSDGFERPLTHTSKAYPKPAQLLIHELTHAWQIHHQSFAPGWICSGLITQAKNSLISSAYRYGAPDRPWEKFGLEAQGAIVDQWFGGTRVADQKPMDPADPYFRYIRDNIRAGKS